MSRLLENSPQYRDTHISRNVYDKNDGYNIAHPNAKSDGDEFGKGLSNDQIGGLTDIKSKEKMLARNIYNQNNEYNINNA